MIILRKSFIKISLAAVLIFATFACGRKETPPQPKEQESPTVTAPQPKEQEDPTLAAVATLFKKWDDAFNTKDRDKLMEIIPHEIKDRLPEDSKKICGEMVNDLALELRDINTSVDRIVIENDEETKATAYTTYTAIDLKTQKLSKESHSYPIIKESGDWKIDIQRWVESRRAKSSPAEPKSGLVVSLTYEDWKYGYRIYAAEVYNSGDKTESVSPYNFILVNDRNESIEAKIPFERELGSYENLVNLHVLPNTRTKGYLFFKTGRPVQYIVFLRTGEKIPISNLK
jgi:hypothetical protein